MSHFYGTMQGHRGGVSRTATKKHGMKAHVRGWNDGIEILSYYNDELDKDCFYVYKTGGSKHPETRTLIYNSASETLREE